MLLVGVLERSFRVLGWFDTHSDVREIIMCFFFFGISNFLLDQFFLIT